jgi:hypothetical protein
MILFEMIRLYCKKQKIGPRQLSRETGMPVATAADFLNSKTDLDAKNLALLLRWVLQKQEDKE